MSKFKIKNNEYYNLALNEELKNKVSYQNWSCDTFNFNFSDEELTEEIKKHLMIFTTEMGFSNRSFSSIDSWINISKPTNFQETHIHSMCHFSVAYYIKVPNNSGGIIFRNHDDLTNVFPIPIKIEDKETLFNCPTYRIMPSECDLLIFKSNLPHMVEKNNSNHDRVSISMNFRIDD